MQRTQPRGDILMHLHLEGWVDPTQAACHLGHDLGPRDAKMAQCLLWNDDHQLCCGFVWKSHLQSACSARCINRLNSACPCDTVARCCSSTLIAVFQQAMMTWIPGGDRPREAWTPEVINNDRLQPPAAGSATDRHEMATGRRRPGLKARSFVVRSLLT